MDPNETLCLLRDELKHGELECAQELFEALDVWLMRGGFLPKDWQDAQERPRTRQDIMRKVKGVKGGSR